MLLGAAATAALPPVGVPPLLVVAFTGLVWLIDGTRGARAAAAVGWWFGLGHFVAGLYWFAFALLTDPARYGWLIPPAILGISAVLALYFAAVAAIARLCPAGPTRVVGLALAWTAAELLRARLLTGFPWNLIASAWTISDAMMQTMALVGAYGLGLITVLAAAMPATLVGAGRRRWLPTALTTALLLAAWAGGAWRLNGGSTAFVDGVLLRLVQPNIAQTNKWKRDRMAANFDRVLGLVRSSGFTAVTQVILPETAVPYLIGEDVVARLRLAAATPPGGLLITGAIRRERAADGTPRLWNSLYAIEPSGAVAGVYDKFHLVPFGEYVPFRRLLPVTKLTAGSIDFSAGPGPRSLRLPGLPPAGPLICYEVIFPHQVVDPSDRPAWLLNITNDAWFGMSSGPYQHFAAARMRAVEQGLPLARAANNGITGVIDPYGRVIARLGLGQTGVVDAPLPVALAAPTPYARFGDAIPLGLIAVGSIGLLAWIRRRRPS